MLSGEKSLTEIVVTTPQNLRLISGASGSQTLAGLSAVQVGKLVQSFSDLPEELDYLIVDMAAGIAPAVVTLMAACHRRFIVMRNDPSSIADAYGTIKVLLEDEQMNEIYLVPNAVNNPLAGEELFQKIKLAQAVTELTAVEKPSGAVQFFVNRWFPPKLPSDLH